MKSSHITIDIHGKNIAKVQEDNYPASILERYHHGGAAARRGWREPCGRGLTCK